MLRKYVNDTGSLCNSRDCFFHYRAFNNFQVMTALSNLNRSKSLVGWVARAPRMTAAPEGVQARLYVMF